jgi:hypothetical protein
VEPAPADSVEPAASKAGRLPANVIQKVIRQNYGWFHACHATEPERNPRLVGYVTLRFQIEESGSVGHVAILRNEVPSCEVVECVRLAMSRLEFPPPEGGAVTVVYPIRIGSH